jgi:hypothetical protein
MPRRIGGNVTEVSSKREIRTPSFECPLLDRMARLVIEELVIRPVGTRSLVDFDCQNSLECGIGTKTGAGYSLDWGRCPARQKYPAV